MSEEEKTLEANLKDAIINKKRSYQDLTSLEVPE